MKQVKDLVPKTKFDNSGIEELHQLSDEEIAPIIPELLAWMKDMTWPIAKEMPMLLAKHQKILIPHIIDVLLPEQDESDWKTFIIHSLLPLLDTDYLLMLKPYLNRIVKQPTEGEISENTNIAVEDFFQEKEWLIIPEATNKSGQGY